MAFNGQVVVRPMMYLALSYDHRIIDGRESVSFLVRVKELLENHFDSIHGLIHCSGGGQTKVLHFIDNLHIIKDNLFEIPPLFKFIHGASGTELKEMYKVFNMGHRMEIYIPESFADTIIALANRFHIDARIIGRVESSDQKKVTLRTPEGEFTYS